MLRKSSASIPSKMATRTSNGEPPDPKSPKIRLGDSPSTPSNLDPTAPVFRHSSSEEDGEEATSLMAALIPAATAAAVEHTEYVLAWDIEKSGPRTDKHSMLALGAVLVRVADDYVPPDGEFRVFIEMEEGHDFSEVCRREYWYNWKDFPNNKNVLKAIKAHGAQPAVAIRQFADWLDRQERTYPSLALVTDNPASDAKWVSHYFEKYLDRNPMIHPFGDETKYRRLHHSNAFARAISLDDGSGGQWCDRLRKRGIMVPPNSLHDHDPLNDAKWIALLYTACIRYTHKWRQLWNENQASAINRFGTVSPIGFEKEDQATTGVVPILSSVAPAQDFTVSTVPIWLRPQDRVHQHNGGNGNSPLRKSFVHKTSNSI